MSSLENGGQIIVDPNDLRVHVTEFYKNLFGRAETADIHLENDMWDTTSQISPKENE
jgi:hypothetical protein